MFYSFNNALGKDLNGFWTNWFFSNNYIDFAIQNIGGYVGPMNVAVAF